MGVPVRVSINKLYLVPKRIMAGLVGRGLGTGKSYIPVVLFDSVMHRSPSVSPCFPMKHNRRVVQQRTAEGATSRQNSED